MTVKQPNCRKCRHYYITWDVKHPYGCRAMGFKSRHNPGLEVRRAMYGEPCLMFSPKKVSRCKSANPRVV